MRINDSLLLFLLSFSTFCVLFTSCSNDNQIEQKNVLKGLKAKSQTVELTEVPCLKTFPGRVRSKVQVLLAAKMPGYVRKVPVQIGQAVRKGELLVAIDDTDVRSKIESLMAMKRAAGAELDAIEARYEYSKINFDRFSRLFREASATKDELDRARTEYQALKNQVEAIRSRIASIDAQLKEARNQLSYLSINAPLDGWVVDRMVDPGTYVNPGQPVIKMEGKGVGFWFEAAIDESLMGRIIVGDEVVVSLPALDLTMKAKVEHVQRSSSTSTNTFTLLADLGDSNIKSGIFGRVFVNLGMSKQLILPLNAVIRRSGLDGVYVVDDKNIIHWRVIRLGRLWKEKDGRFFPYSKELDSNTEEIYNRKDGLFATVLSGLSPDERILVSNLSQAREGLRLE